MKNMVTIAGLVCGLGLATACGGRSNRVPEADIGIAPREDGTGAVETVDTDGQPSVETVQQMLRGRVAGLQVVDLPGCGLTIRIRGMTDALHGDDQADCSREPLLIIDDKPVALGQMDAALRGLTSHDIERIRVLKDIASTSVYGTRAAHGVILITTKH